MNCNFRNQQRYLFTLFDKKYMNDTGYIAKNNTGNFKSQNLIGSIGITIITFFFLENGVYVGYFKTEINSMLKGHTRIESYSISDTIW